MGGREEFNFGSEEQGRRLKRVWVEAEAHGARVQGVCVCVCVGMCVCVWGDVCVCVWCVCGVCVGMCVCVWCVCGV